MKARASDSALSTSRTATTVREPLYRQLKPGPGLSAEAVVTNQRARLFGAMVEMVADGGYGSVKVREISRLAGVSTRTFYDRFANVEDCFACTYSWILGEALISALEAHAGAWGVQRWWLLTTTAERFFVARGFVASERAAAPAAIRATGQFNGGCSCAAVCLTRERRNAAP